MGGPSSQCGRNTPYRAAVINCHIHDQRCKIFYWELTVFVRIVEFHKKRAFLLGVFFEVDSAEMI
jgi:hypothetical protein